MIFQTYIPVNIVEKGSGVKSCKTSLSFNSGYNLFTFTRIVQLFSSSISTEGEIKRGVIPEKSYDFLNPCTSFLSRSKYSVI